MLNKKQIEIACSIAKKLMKFRLSINNNITISKNLSTLKNEILKYKIKLDYLEIRNKTNLTKKFNKYNFKIFIAYYLKNVRLIDNF